MPDTRTVPLTGQEVTLRLVTFARLSLPEAQRVADWLTRNGWDATAPRPSETPTGRVWRVSGSRSTIEEVLL